MSTLFTIGHSTRDIDVLVELLSEHDIELLMDVRRFPGSKRHPQFNKGNMAQSLPAVGIEYRHEERLGGRRGKPGKNSPNGGWQSDGFQAYADHLLSDTGQEAINELRRTAANKPTAIMCAEAVPWRCHRQIISDHLVARGFRVIHILGPGQTDNHVLRNMAHVIDEKKVIYPPEGEQEELFDE
jgi:uncharacterized protein (DUF488 family)